MDNLLDDVTGLVGFYIVPEPDNSSHDVSDDSFEDDEDKESDEISIYFCAIWTRSCSFACSIADFCNLLIFKNLLLLIHTSVHLRLFLLFFCFFL